MNDDQIIKFIKQEFPDSPIPKSVLKEGASQNLYDGVDATDELLKNKKWNEVNLNSAKNDFWHCFTIMSNQAFEYYFPAFLKHFIYEKKPNTLLLDAFLDVINPRNAINDERLEFFLNFDEKKEKIVFLFLEAILKRRNSKLAKEALEDYWDKFS